MFDKVLNLYCTKDPIISILLRPAFKQSIEKSVDSHALAHVNFGVGALLAGLAITVLISCRHSFGFWYLLIYPRVGAKYRLHMALAKPHLQPLSCASQSRQVEGPLIEWLAEQLDRHPAVRDSARMAWWHLLTAAAALKLSRVISLCSAFHQ